MRSIRCAVPGLLLALGLVLPLGLGSMASAVTVDGVLSPGEWVLIDDTTDNDHGAIDMRRWGWQIDYDAAGGPMFYAAFEVWDTIQTGPHQGEASPTLDLYESTDFSSTKFPGIWFNVDPNAATPTGTAGDCQFNRADETRTCDVNIEMGSDFGLIISDPQNPSVGDPNPASLNFWGTDGDAGNSFGLSWNCSDGIFYYSGYVVEIGVRLSLVKTAANKASGAVADPVTWRIGSRMAGSGHPEVGADWTGDLNGVTNDECTIWIIVARPGDANGDGVVDAKDASILGANWLSSDAGWTVDEGWTKGDFNGDNAVNDKDAAILAAHWGDGLPMGSVPEPGTLCLLVLGALALVGRRLLKR